MSRVTFRNFAKIDDGTVPVPALVKQYCDSNGCQVTCTPTSSQSCIRYSFYSKFNVIKKFSTNQHIKL